MNYPGRMVLESLEKLLALPEITPQSVGFALRCKGGYSNSGAEMFSRRVWYWSGQREQLGVIEIRSLEPVTSLSNCLVVLTLDRGVVLRGKEILLRFGKPDEVTTSGSDCPVKGQIYRYKKSSHLCAFKIDEVTDKVTHVILYSGLHFRQ